MERDEPASLHLCLDVLHVATCRLSFGLEMKLVKYDPIEVLKLTVALEFILLSSYFNLCECVSEHCFRFIVQQCAFSIPPSSTAILSSFFVVCVWWTVLSTAFCTLPPEPQGRKQAIFSHQTGDGPNRHIIFSLALSLSLPPSLPQLSLSFSKICCTTALQMYTMAKPSESSSSVSSLRTEIRSAFNSA